VPEFGITPYMSFIFETEAKKLAIQGCTILAASGDNGASGDMAGMMG
jgi:subtilase family serine protease